MLGGRFQNNIGLKVAKVKKVWETAGWNSVWVFSDIITLSNDFLKILCFLTHKSENLKAFTENQGSTFGNSLWKDC